MGTIRKITACLAFAAVLMAAGCGNSGDTLQMVSEIDREASTVTIGGDSFTLPCEVGEFIEKGYTFSSDGKVTNPEKMLVPGKTRIYYLCVEKGKDGLTGVFVVNMDIKTKPLSDCIVYCMAYHYDKYYEGYSVDWEYMGLTACSTPENVQAVFDEAFGSEYHEYDDYFSISNGEDDEDKRTVCIEFAKNENGGSTQILKMSVCVVPDAKIRNYEDFSVNGILYRKEQ